MAGIQTAMGSGLSFIGLSIDFEEAYDRVCWNNIAASLDVYGRIYQLIYTLISNVVSHLTLNANMVGK